jgi:hypothetical protein
MEELLMHQQMKAHAVGRTKHGYADSGILSTTGIVDPVERVHCKVRQE